MRKRKTLTRMAKKTADEQCIDDLREERVTCSFNKHEITTLLDGGEEKTRQRRRIGENNV